MVRRSRAGFLVGLAGLAAVLLGIFLLSRSRTAPPPEHRLQHLESRAKAGKASPSELVELGEIFLARNEPLKAGEMGFRARKADPSLSGPHNLLGVIYARIGEQDKAHGSFEKALECKPGALAPRLNLARLEIQRDEPRRALLVLQEAVRQAPSDPVVWLLVGQAQRLEESLTASESSFKKAIQLKPDLWEAHLRLGMLQADRDQPAQAVPHLEAAYREGDRSPVTLSYLALTLLTSRGSEEDVARAEQLLDEAKSPQIPPAWFARGVVLQRKGDHAGARREFEKVLRLEPRHQRAQYALAETYRLEGNRAAASRELQRYHRMVTERQRANTLHDRIASEGATPTLLRDYGIALLAADRPEEAVQQFRDWAQKAPKDPEPRRWLKKAMDRARPGGDRS